MYRSILAPRDSGFSRIRSSAFVARTPVVCLGGHQVRRHVGAAAVDVADDRRPLALTSVVTCTVSCVDGGTSTSRRPVSLPSFERARTMHTAGRDGSSRVTVNVTCTLRRRPVIPARLALDLAGAEPLRSDHRDRRPRPRGPARSAPMAIQRRLLRDSAAARSGRRDARSSRFACPSGRIDLQNWNYRATEMVGTVSTSVDAESAETSR